MEGKLLEHYLAQSAVSERLKRRDTQASLASGHHGPHPLSVCGSVCTHLCAP